MFTSFFSLFAHPLPARAAALTWDGGGADNNWSTCANWTTDTCPAAGDTVTFNGTSTKSVTIDAGAPASVATLTIAAGYTGTITLARTFATTTTFSQATGTFTASNQSFTMAAFTLSGGTFTASSGTTTISGAVTVTGTPTFNHNSGTVNFTGGTATIACNGISLNLATFNNTAAKTISSGCSIPIGNNPTIANAITLNGTLTGSGTLTTTTGTFLLGTTGSLSGFSGMTSGGGMTVNGTLNAGSYSPFTVNGSFALGAASNFTAPSGTMSVVGLSITAGATFNANGGTIDYTGGTSSSTCGSVTFNLITFHNTSTKTIGSDCTLPLGNNPTIANGVTLNGTMSGTGTLSTTAGTFTLGTTGVLSGFSGISTGAALTINGTLNAGSYSTFTSGGAFTLGAASVFTAPSGSMNLQGSVTFNAGMTFNANSGTVNLIGNTGTIACANATFNLVTISAGTNIKTINSDCNLPLGNNPSITRVVLNGTLSGTGTLLHTTSTFQLNAGATLSGFTGLQDNVSLIIAGASLDANTFSTFNILGGLNVSSGSFTATTSGFSIGTTLTMSGGTFNAPSGTLNVSALNISGGTFNANGGLVNINNGTGSLTCGSAVFNLVTFSNYGPKTINSGCTLPLGNDPTFNNSGKLVFNGGVVTGTGNLTVGADIDMLAGNPLSGFDGLTISNADLVIGSSNVDLGSLNTLVVGGNFNQGFPYGGSFTFTAPSGTMYVGGDFYVNLNGTTFDSNGGTIVFEGTNGQNAICGTATFNLITFNKSAGYFSVGVDCNLPLGSNPVIVMGSDPLYVFGTLSGTGTINDTVGTLDLASSSALSGFSGLNANNLYIDGFAVDLGAYNTLDVNGNFLVTNSGAFTTTSANMTVGGNFQIDPGSTFNANGGTVILDGSNQIIMGTTFNNLTKIVASADTLTFPAGGTETILGNLILKGGSATELLTLVSSSPGTPWQIDAQGSRTLQYLNVADSNNINAAEMVAYDSVNGGGNTFWSFQDTPVPPTPTPSPASPASTTGSNGAVTYWQHPAGIIEGAVTVTTDNNQQNNNDNGNNTNKPMRNYVYLWWTSATAILLFAALLAYLLYTGDKKKHQTTKK